MIPVVSNNKVRCVFCYMETQDAIVASKEHLLSRPVADAFGIERTDPVARINGEITDLNVVADIKWSRLNGIQRKCVCQSCNSGWMNRLEHGMKSIADWLDGDPAEPLGAERNIVLRNWAVKSHILLCYIDGNAGRWDDETLQEEYVVPPVTPARELYEDQQGAALRFAVGLAKSAANTDFAWSFGFPNVRSSETAPGAVRFAPLTILTVGDLQLWVVTPLMDAQVSAPDGVISSTPDVRPRDLTSRGHSLNLNELTVDFG